MNIITTPCEVYEITESPGLDPIRVFLQDLAPGQGRIVIECFGVAFSSYFGGIGKATIRKFVTVVDAEYLLDRFTTPHHKKEPQRKAYFLRIIAAVQDGLKKVPDPIIIDNAAIEAADDDTLKASVLISAAAEQMAERLRVLMGMHSRMLPKMSHYIGGTIVSNWGAEGHWWMEKLGDYFNDTDAVDVEDLRDQAWDQVFDLARKHFPLEADGKEGT